MYCFHFKNYLRERFFRLNFSRKNRLTFSQTYSTLRQRRIKNNNMEIIQMK